VTAKSDVIDLLQAARCEDLQYGQIRELSVLGDFEQKVIMTLKGAGAHLLQGARGVGKSMLLRSAEIEMDSAFAKEAQLAVYVNFKTSTLLEGVKAGERDGFQLWVNLKILQALHDKLVQLDLIGHGADQDPYYRVFGIESVDSTTQALQEKIHLLQKLARASEKEGVLTRLGTDFLDRVLDTNFLIEMVRGVAEQFQVKRLVLLFDEAAHTFIPAQQEIFFEIFKLLHGDNLAVKAAVYPTVTSYGRNFEIGQDAIVISMDRFEPGEAGRAANRRLFRDLLDRRLPEKSPLRKKIFGRGAIPPNAKFCPECGNKLETTSIIGPLLDEYVDSLSLSRALCERVRPQFPRVGDVVQASREEIMRIKWIKEVRSRIIKNAADEFISG
jgi:hypothetical protein